MAGRAGTFVGITIAAAALVAIGAGTGAVAATMITGAQIKDGTVTSADIKNETLKSADVLNGSLTGGDIKNETLRSADVLNGSLIGADIKDGSIGVADLAAGLLPRGYTASNAGNVNLPAGAGTTTVLQLPLPKGTYLVVASGGVNNNGAAVFNPVTCRVVAGASIVEMATNLGLGGNVSTGETAWGAASTVATLAADGAASIECVRNSNWASGNFLRPSISAVSVQPAS